MTPAELNAAVAKTNSIILAACPVYDKVTGAEVPRTDGFDYFDVMVRKALTYGWATPEQLAASVIVTIKSIRPFADLPGYWSGWAHVNSEGYTNLADQFAPPGTGVKAPLSAAQIQYNAMATANVQRARDGKDFLGLDGKSYDPWGTTPAYVAAKSALIAASVAQPVPTGGQPFGVGPYAGPERRVSGVIDRRSAVSTGGGQAHVG
jgi:hypothetical protein